MAHLSAWICCLALQAPEGVLRAVQHVFFAPSIVFEESEEKVAGDCRPVVTKPSVSPDGFGPAYCRHIGRVLPFYHSENEVTPFPSNVFLKTKTWREVPLG